MSLLGWFRNLTVVSGYRNYPPSPDGVKNVVFIGLTQNGKSTLIRSMLTYGGLESEANKVKVGDNNSSTTRKCSEYLGKVRLKKHTVRSKSRPHAGSIEPKEDLDMTDYSVEQIDTDRYVELNLIDTPGLSDSDNPEKRGSNMYVLDERHKLGILVALNNVSHVHAVCFVVSVHESYSDSFQRRINQLVRLIDSSFGEQATKINYHVIHTWVTISDRFPENPHAASLESREITFKTKIHLGTHARHHFIDSTPHKDDLLGQYFCKRIMSELLHAFSIASGVPTTSLTYPRDIGHVVNDKALQGVARIIQDQFKEEITKSRAEITGLKEDIWPLRELEKQFAAQKQELRSKIEEYDTEELVNVGGGSDSIETKWHQFSMIYKRMAYSSSTIIRDVKKNCTNGKFDAESRSEKSYSVYLNTVNYSRAYGTVEIYSYKRDVYATKIKELQEEICSIDNEYQTVVGAKITTLDQKIQKSEESIRTISSKIATIEAQLGVIRYLGQTTFGANHPESFSVQTFGDKLKYFTCDNLYAAGKAYDISYTVSRTVIPLTFNFAAAKDGMLAKLKEHIRLASEKGKAITKLKTQIRGNESILRVLELLTVKIPDLINHAVRQLETELMGLPQPPARGLTMAEWKAIRADLLAAGAAARPEHLQICEYTTGMLWSVAITDMEQVEEFESQLERLESCIANLQPWVDEKRMEVKKLETEKLECLEMIKAMREAQKMIEADEFTIGAFAVVVKAIHQEEANPYLSFCNAIKETLFVENLAL